MAPCYILKFSMSIDSIPMAYYYQNMPVANITGELKTPFISYACISYFGDRCMRLNLILSYFYFLFIFQLVNVQPRI